MAHDERPRGGRGRFATTQWSLVLAAGGPADTPAAREALATLCQAYWPPIYAYLRRRGADTDRARDLTQGFFAQLLEKNYVGDARPERGRFRTFLLTSLQNYASNVWDREHAKKRGGETPPISIDAAEAEHGYRLEPFHEETPERIFDRRWARTLLEASLDRLREETKGSGGAARYDLLVPFVGGDAPSGYREVAEELQMTEAATRVTVHRMRRRLRAILRDEVARTVQEEAQVDDELRHLFSVLGA